MSAVETATDIRTFHVDVPEEKIDDLRRRIESTRWPSKELVDDRSQGVQLAALKALASYWMNDYDWRKAEAKLNALPQFVTAIDGLDIHFIHVCSEHEDALPLVMTHGWPGSVIELLETIGPLTDPTAHGGTADDAFHIVLPSVPGYGFSAEPTELGWWAGRAAQAWPELMRRLGYTRYVAQGGDVGAHVSPLGDVARVPEAVHQLGPRRRDANDIPAELGRLAGEAVAGQGRQHQVERVLGGAAVRGRVGERADDPEQLDDRAGPAVRHDQRQRVRVRRLHVDEMDVHPVDPGHELRQRVQFRLAPAPVVLGRPVAGQLLDRGQLHALRPVGDQLPGGPARRGDATPEVGDRFLGHVDPEGMDFCFAGHTSPPSGLSLWR